VFGIRFNALLSAVLCVFAAVWFVVLGRRNRPARSDPDGSETPSSEPSDPDAISPGPVSS
jgi:hypothetical protein